MRPPRVSLWTHLLLLVAGVGLLALFVYRADPAAVWDLARRFPLSALPWAGALYAIGWACRATRLLALSRAIGEPHPPARAASLAIGANCLNLLLPARLGDAALVTSLSRTHRWGASLLMVTHWRLFDVAALGLLAAGLVAIHTTGAGTASAWSAVAGLTALFALVASLLLGWLVRRFNPWFVSASLWVAKRIGRDDAHVRSESVGQKSVHLVRFPILFPGLLLACAAWLLDAFVANVFLAGVGVDVPFRTVLTATLVANLAKMLPTTPGGLGVFEGAFTAVLSNAGVAAAPAITAATLTHLFMNLFTVALGAPGAYRIAHDASSVGVAWWRGRRRSAEGVNGGSS